MKKQFLVLLATCFFLTAPDAKAGEWSLDLPFHMAILMSAEAVKNFGDDPAKYEGVEFPLYCGIASIYPKENRFVFTKMTNLPILGVEDVLRQIERDGYIIEYNHYIVEDNHLSLLHVPVKDRNFYFSFSSLASSRCFDVYRVSHADEIPVDYVPQFTRTCRYSTAKTPPIDCAYDIGEFKDLYIRPTDEEINATIDWKRYE